MIKKIFGKKKEGEEIPVEKEVKMLRKENKQLKESLHEQVVKKFLTRRSIRKFSDKDVDFKVIYDIVECGLNAPCAGNCQNSKIIVVENKNKKIDCGKLAQQQYWVADAPYLLVVVRDDYEVKSLFQERGHIFSVQNTAALIENILLSAHFHDLGACWVDAEDSPVLKEMLEIPENMHVDAIIPIGHPMENPKVKKAPTVGMVYFEKFNNRVKGKKK